MADGWPSTAGDADTVPYNVQQQVQQLLNGLVARNEERGLQVAAYLEGELVVDAWAGLADPAARRAVDGDTLFPVFSTTKGVAATAVHILVARGLLDYEAPIAKVWPEFGKHGKERITLRHALSHLAGIPQMPDHCACSDLGDWENMCRKVADLAPLWPPGSRIYYHALTYGWLVGEVARRADGRDFGTIVREEIARPLGIDSLFIGIPDQVEPRIAALEPAGNVKSMPDSPPIANPIRSLAPGMAPLEKFMSRPDMRRACLPACNGIMNARAIARHYAALIGNGVGGIRLFNDAILWEVTRRNLADNGSADNGYGLGYSLCAPARNRPADDPGSIFGFGGYGGSCGLAYVQRRLAVGIAKNRMTVEGVAEHTTAGKILKAIEAALL